ncbi:Rv3235 family protein [Sphaerisporangium aureirubrum]|uniref:Rv3235 family protein n=1 Tax=Sphaerisporangium aureirubrum TaxID=1544736 RepID=A0ABW1NUP1_9ACTN
MSRPPCRACVPGLRPPPSADPPYDDDRRAGRVAPPAGQGALALAHLPARTGPYARGDATPGERVLRGLAQAMAEVLAGRRPAGVVAGRLTEQAYGELLRAGRMISSPRQPLVGRPHVARPRDGVIEFCVLVHCGERSRVLALRLERGRRHWLCTDFETA